MRGSLELQDVILKEGRRQKAREVLDVQRGHDDRQGLLEAVGADGVATAAANFLLNVAPEINDTFLNMNGKKSIHIPLKLVVGTNSTAILVNNENSS